MTPVPPLPRPGRPRREPLHLGGLARFTGLAALATALGRTPLFRNRHRAVQAASGLVSAVATLAIAALLVPPARPPIVALLQLPGQLIHQLGGGSADSGVDRGYPRIYSLALNIDLAIRPGDGKAPPVQPIAYQFPGTAPLGSAGNTYLYAHDRRGMFNGLHNARLGDVIIVALTPAQKLYYQVAEIHPDVAWDDLEWTRPTGDARLTLQTCNYSGDYDPRYVVVTREISANQGQALTNGG